MNMFKIAKPQGFTLIELLVITGIIGLTLSIGLPSFQTSMATNRLNTAVNDMIAALQMARSESIKTMHFTGVTYNAGGTSWDAVLTGSPNVVLQQYTAAANVTLNITSSTVVAGDFIVKYRADGRVLTNAPVVMEFTMAGSSEKRRITVQPSGAVSQMVF